MASILTCSGVRPHKNRSMSELGYAVEWKYVLIALFDSLAFAGRGLKHARTDPPAATTLFQSTSWDKEPSVKINQFF